MDAVRLLHEDLEEIRLLLTNFHPASLPLEELRARLARLGERLRSHLALEESLLTLMRISAFARADCALVALADQAVAKTHASVDAFMAPYVRPAELVLRLSLLKVTLESHARKLHGETLPAASRMLPPVVLASVGELLEARLTQGRHWAAS